MQRASKVLTGHSGELEGNAAGDAAAADDDSSVDDEGDSNSCPPLSPFCLPGSFTCSKSLNPAATQPSRFQP